MLADGCLVFMQEPTALLGIVFDRLQLLEQMTKSYSITALLQIGSAYLPHDTPSWLLLILLNKCKVTLSLGFSAQMRDLIKVPSWYFFVIYCNFFLINIILSEIAPITTSFLPKLSASSPITFWLECYSRTEGHYSLVLPVYFHNDSIILLLCT